MHTMSARLFPILALAAASVGSGAPHASTPAGDAHQILHAMARAVDGVRDYTMTLIIEEWSGDEMGPAETLATKWARPFQVYFKRLNEPQRGREILFAHGWNGDKLKVSVHAWPVNIRLNPNPRGRDLRVNVGLGPQDFSPANPAYSF